MDFAKCISDLRTAGWTQAAIGTAVGLSQPAIADLEAGRRKQPRWAAGDALLELHARVCGAGEATVEEPVSSTA
jgi:transcriptional regulator with XRE-family HTH domain